MNNQDWLSHIHELQENITAISSGAPGERLERSGHSALDELVAAINLLLDRLELSEARDRTILEGMEDGYFELDADARLVSSNPAFLKMLGYTAASLTGRTFATLQAQLEAPADRVPSVTEIESGAPASTWLTRADGSVGYFEAQISRIQGAAGGTVGYRGILHDVSLHVQHQQTLHEMVYRDVLTGLGNRKACYEDLKASLNNGSSPLALLFIDLDRFKQVNDTFGHDLGDALLQCLAERLRTSLHAPLKAYRLGGDEFTVLCPGADSQAAISLSEKLIHELSRPVSIDDLSIDFVTPSIGLALAPDHASTGSDLLRCADEAMYNAKKQRASACMYKPDR